MIDVTHGTIHEMFVARVSASGDGTCFLIQTPGDGFESVTWNALAGTVDGISRFLRSKGVKKGDRVAICSLNRPWWWAVDLAIHSIGAVTVAVYPRASADSLGYIMEHCGASVCFVDSAENLDKLQSVRKRIRSLKLAVVMDPVSPLPAKTVNFDRLTARPVKGSVPERKAAGPSPSDIATIVYTQSMTGNPRGVVLTHGNIMADVRQVARALGDAIHDRHVFLSVLPLANMFERTLGFYLPVAAGASVAFADNDARQVMANFRQVRPTFIVGVPFMYERLHSGILSMIPGMFMVKKAMMKMALQVSLLNVPNTCENRPRTGFFKKQYDFFDRHVYGGLKKEIGLDRLECALSCGAPLAISDAEFFLGLAIPVLDCYGLAEASPVTHMNIPGRIRPGTVGLPLPETRVIISDDGECLVRGPQVMSTYHRDKKAAKDILTKDGYLHTGDLGVMDYEGYLTITGRLKDIIITAGGKNISPGSIENSLRSSVYIEHAAIIGDRRKYLTALIVPDMEQLMNWAGANQISFHSGPDLLRKEAVKRLIRAEIDEATKNLSRIEHIRDFRIVGDTWSEEGGELTSTGRVNRKFILPEYGELIEEMYSL